MIEFAQPGANPRPAKGNEKEIMKIKWPRGKYNGQRIVGIVAKISVDVTHWRWTPRLYAWSGCLHWLCFRAWLAAEYSGHPYPD